MSAIYPPRKHTVRHVLPDGRLVVSHGSHEVEARFSARDEQTGGQKKVSKEIARERQKAESYRADMSETTATTVGASPADDLSSSFTYEEPQAMFRRKENNPIQDFLKLKRKHDQSFIPSEKTRYYNTMLRVYGTTELEVLKKSLAVEMQADPRIDIRTHRGVVKTTVATQTQYAKERLGARSNLEKR